MRAAADPLRIILAMPDRYPCRVCGGTGKVPVAFDATVGFRGSGISDVPVCAHCHGTGSVAELEQRERDVFDYIGMLASKLWGLVRRQ